MKNTLIFLALFISLINTKISAQNMPYLAAGVSLPIPTNQQLTFDPNISDEFDVGTNGKPHISKWDVADPPNTNGWHGRFPGHFDTDAVSISGGKLRIVASMNNKVLKDYDNQWKTFTHQGGMVTSKQKGLYGYYEAKIKANKTFMSSTFWLITESCSGVPRGTELDILETFGVATQNKHGIKTVGMENYTKRMNCNTHSFGCPGRTNNQEVGTGEFLNAARTTKTSDGYHTYGALWLNKDRIIFYLDGNKIGEVVPQDDFNIDMHLKMVVETYDWNRPKSGSDGMNSSLSDRTTYYEYVRVWKLEDSPYFNHADGLYTITTQVTNKNLEHSTGGNVTAANINTSNHAQQWEIKRVAGISTPVYTIKSRSTGRYLEVPYARCTPNAADPVGTWINDSWNHKKWIIEQTIHNRVCIRPYHCSDKALTSFSHNPTNIIITDKDPVYLDRQAEHRFYIRTIPASALPRIASSSDNNNNNNNNNNTKRQALLDEKMNVQVYPNPVSSNFFNIEAYLPKPSASVRVVLYNVQGMEVFQKQYAAQEKGLLQVKINIENLSLGTGLYYLKVESEEEAISKIINIQK